MSTRSLRETEAESLLLPFAARKAGSAQRQCEWSWQISRSISMVAWAMP